MVDRDILLAKIASIRKCLERIRTVTGRVSESLNDPDIQDIFVLNLQRAVQAAIDLAAHQVADEKIGLPTNLKENFALLESRQIIDAQLSKRLQLDLIILKSILEHRLGDLNEFVQVITKRYHNFK
jgi:uncharacterized protein YutE (UPF0331/DUF86 family)